LKEETYAAIITGKRPLTDFDRYVEDWYTSGGEQLTREANAWWTSLKAQSR